MEKNTLFLKFMRLLPAVGLTFILSACSAINLKSAQELSTVGSKASMNIGESIEVTRQNLDRYLDGQALLTGLRDGHSPPSEDMKNSIKNVGESLAMREKVFQQLTKVYGALNNLTSFDASGETEKSIEELGGTINAFVKTIEPNTTNLFPNTAISVVSGIGGMVAEESLKKKVKKASSLIRERLIVLVDFMRQAKEKAAMVSVREELTRTDGMATVYIWKNGLAKADPILKEMVEPYALVIDNKRTNHILTGNEKFKKAIIAVIKRRNKTKQEAISDSYEQSIAIINRLIAAHVKLEKGEEMSLTILQGHIAKIRTLIDLINKSRSS